MLLETTAYSQQITPMFPKEIMLEPRH